MDYKDPVTWCEQMRDKAKDGDEAYHYHQLAELYRNREGEK